MTDLKTILESKPNVKDYDILNQPYKYINDLHIYINKLEKGSDEAYEQGWSDGANHIFICIKKFSPNLFAYKK